MPRAIHLRGAILDGRIVPLSVASVYTIVKSASPTIIHARPEVLLP